MATGVRVDWGAVADLGVADDRVIARRLKVSVHTVARARCRRGGAKTAGPTGIDWDAVADLGDVLDSEIAARLGCHTSAVKGARKRRGISPAVYVRVILDLPRRIVAEARRRHPRVPEHLAVMMVLREAMDQT